MKVLFTSLILLFSAGVAAHDDLHAQIKKVSKQIEKNPNDPTLYIKRGDLYHQHEEYKRALLDFERARALGHDSDQLTILFAKSYFKAQKHAIALRELEQLLTGNQNHVVANRLAGYIYEDLGELPQAISHLERALKNSQKRIPQYYTELAHLHLLINAASSFDAAVDALQNGIDDLGELIVFLDELMAMHRAKKDYLGAIQWQDRVVTISKRKEIPLYVRAELHYLNGNWDSALTDLTEARKAIDKLPRRLSRSSEVQKISNGINMLRYEIQDKN